MNILVVNGHPDSKSYVSALFKAYVKNIDRNKNNLKVLELGKMNFDPVLRYGYRKRMNFDKEIEMSQNLIKWADHIVLFYPIWFAGPPALVWGWFERVLTPGVAYNMDGYKVKKHFHGKTAHIISTSISPVIYLRLRGNFELKPVKDTLEFCGIKIIKVSRIGHYVVGKYENLKKRKQFIRKISSIAKMI